MKQIERKYCSKQKLLTKIITGCFFISLVWYLAGCDGKPKQQNVETVAMNDDVAFKLPEIPVSLNTSEARGDYLILHYWDNFDFTDRLSISNPETVEQFFVDFVDISSKASILTAKEGINILMQRISQKPDIQIFFIDLLEKYLYDPNSPMRDEELYIPVLEHIVASPDVRAEDKIRSEYRLEMALKNRPGNPATDFKFVDGTGKVRRLSDVQNEYILLYFNNPGCAGCQQVTAQIEESAYSKNTRITILAVYPDSDLAEWKKAQHEIPENWINGYSPSGEVMEKELYDLKAIPTLYLLDRDRKVLLKDATMGQIEMFLYLNMQ